MDIYSAGLNFLDVRLSICLTINRRSVLIRFARFSKHRGNTRRNHLCLSPWVPSLPVEFPWIHPFLRGVLSNAANVCLGRVKGALPRKLPSIIGTFFPCLILFPSMKEQVRFVRFVQGGPALRSVWCFTKPTGLSLTWPTSYEALVGRANLKSGTRFTTVGSGVMFN